MDSTVVFENTPKATVDSFLDELSFEFTDAPYGLLEHYIRRVVMDMCERANILRRVAHIYTQSNIHNYLLEPPDDVHVIAVMSVALGHHVFVPAKFARTNVPVWECDCSCLGHGMNFIHCNGAEINFTHPHSGDDWVVNMSVKPKPDACEFDTSLLYDYAPTVIDGVRAELYGQSDKPWSSVQRAALAEQAYKSGCATIAVDRMLNGQRGTFRAKRGRAF